MPTVVVTGLAQIQRDLAKSGVAVNKAMNTGLREAAEPVSRTAQQLSLRNIRRMPRSPEWAENRIGVTRNAVYIVPKKRGVDSRNPKNRRNLVPLMMERSYTPALEEGTPLIEETVVRLLNTVIGSSTV